MLVNCATLPRRPDASGGVVLAAHTVISAATRPALLVATVVQRIRQILAHRVADNSAVPGIMAAMDRNGAERLNQIVAELRDAVTAFDAATEREIASRARFLAELDRLADPFSRDSEPVHVTGSAIVAGRRGTVLHWHKRIGG